MSRGCGHILGLFYNVNPGLCLYSTGLIYPRDFYSFCVIPINIAVKLIYEIFHRDTYP